MDNNTYSIQQVAAITGLSKQLIRKWEERYHLVQPQRLGNGYRAYNAGDINTFLKVKALVDQGNSVKQAVLLMANYDLHTELPSTQQVSSVDLGPMNQYVLDLLQAGSSYNEAEMHRIIEGAYHQYGLGFFIKSIVIPFLREVGVRWEKGHWGEYQESLASLVIRDFLIQLRRNFKHNQDSPLLLGACLPYEQHEIPVHLILLYALLNGWKTAFLGASPAPGSIESTVKILKPRKVVLSALTMIPFQRDPDYLRRLEDFALEHQDVQFFLGGRGALQYSQKVQLKALRITNSIEEIFSVG